MRKFEHDDLIIVGGLLAIIGLVVFNLVTHDHDAVVSVCGEYYKNKYTGEWLSELEAEQAMIDKYEEDESNKYY